MYKSDVEALDAFAAKYKELKSEVAKVIVGQDGVVREILISVFSDGHSLLIGVPGLAKTLMVHTIADVLDLSFNRIQFTPDLMPSDIVGSEILEENRTFRFNRGPVFANIILADEINRTPPKTQSALLEAMQERSVTISGKKHSLDLPFFVLATQNQLIRRIPIADNVMQYAVKLASSTRPNREGSPTSVNNYISWGAGPRASQYLVLGAKTHAAIHGKYSPDIEDVKAVALPILRHRVFKNYKAEAEGLSIDKIIGGLL
ncbi:MAG: AAA family ATPase [Bacteroidetes bacterium]|nr:AAA family ATPase [Bacteroidota bacterium]